MRMPTLPWASPAQNRSDRSVYWIRGKGVWAAGTIYSSMAPVENTPSMSMSRSWAATCSTRWGLVIPSIYKMSTSVADWRPTICS